MQLASIFSNRLSVRNVNIIKWSSTCSSHGDLHRWRFTVHLVCLWIDIDDHSKFQPRIVLAIAELRDELLINPRPEGYGSRFVVH